MFPHNGKQFPGFFHTMEACFGHFSTQWKRVLPRVAAGEKAGGGRSSVFPAKRGRDLTVGAGGR